MTREDMVKEANETAMLSVELMLSVGSSAQDIARWLQWCDPNGDHMGDGEFEPYSLQEAWDALEAMLEG